MFFILIPLGLVATVVTLIIVVAIIGWLLSTAQGTFFLVCIVFWVIWMAFWHLGGGKKRSQH